MPHEVPEGWYADPQSSAPGAERWWNGVQWTAHTREAPAAPPPPTGAPSPGPAPGEATAPPPSAGTGAGPQLSGLAAGLSSTPRFAADGERLAGPAVRAAAWVVDWLLVGFVTAVLGLGLRLVVAVVEGAVGGPGGRFGPDADRVLDLAWLFVTAIGSLAIWLAYQVYFLTRGGATPGKQLTGIVVRPAEAPGPLSARRAAVRALVAGLHLLAVTPASQVLRVFVLVDAVFGLSHPRLQTLHDRAAGTVVVVRDAARPRGWGAPGRPPPSA